MQDSPSWWRRNAGVSVGRGGLRAVDNCFKLCLVGRFFSDRQIKLNFMSTTMASTWRPVCGVTIKEIGENRYLSVLPRTRPATNPRQWPLVIRKCTLVLSRIKNNELPQTVALDKAMFWVQAYNLPSGFFSEHVARIIGDCVGTFVESDPNNYTSIWRNFLHV